MSVNFISINIFYIWNIILLSQKSTPYEEFDEIHQFFLEGISEPGHGKEVVDGINAVYKRYIYQLVYTVQLPRSNLFDSLMQINTDNQKDDVSLAK